MEMKYVGLEFVINSFERKRSFFHLVQAAGTGIVGKIKLLALQLCKYDCFAIVL